MFAEQINFTPRTVFYKAGKIHAIGGAKITIKNWLKKSIFRLSYLSNIQLFEDMLQHEGLRNIKCCKCEHPFISFSE
jgi:hypothetical protein